MTQYHADRKFTLAGAPRHVRILITAFNVVILLALAVGVVNYWDKTGMTPDGVRAWYRGDDAEALPTSGAMTFEKTFRELLDATHPHLFGQGVLLFILSHIVALSSLSERRKIALYLFSFAAMLVDAAMPWLIRYVSPALAPLSIVSLVSLTLAFALQIIVPIRDMWFPPRRRGMGPTRAAAAAVMLLAAGAASAEPEPEHRRVWLIMGTTCDVTLRSDDPARARAGFDAAYREMSRVDSLMSLYRPSSELVRVNREASDRAVPVSEATWEVLTAALSMARASDGAFDVTVKPLMDLWGFYRRAGRRPGPESVDSVLVHVGWREVRLDEARHTIQFDRPGMSLDFGGIAKGYAIDRAMTAVAALGIDDALIDLGGNIRARGDAGADGWGWPVALRKAAMPDSISGVIWLRDESVSVSGAYEKFVILDGVRYGHILDVRRGEPVTGVLGTVVVAGSAMLADALSTTLFVLGAEALGWLAGHQPDAEAAVTLEDGRGGKTFYSSASRFAPRRSGQTTSVAIGP